MFKALTRLHNYGFSVRTYHNFYNGEFVPSKGTSFYDVYNPVTQELIARSPQSTEEEFNAIVANAKEAFTTWSRVPLLSTGFVIQLVRGTCSTSLPSSAGTTKSWLPLSPKSTERLLLTPWAMCSVDLK
jgi:hypothetical protein